MRYTEYFLDKMVIHYVNYCMGSRVGNDIYLHNKLKQFPLFHKHILDHELQHSIGFNMKDFLLDLLPEKKSKELKKEIASFKQILTRRESILLCLHNLSPIWKIDKTITINPFKIIMYLMGILCGYIVGISFSIII